ncbi:hypothetical protein H0N96_03440, partial [Candidatus Micrarchaeota archaeon]|nr:hypothetical protein [Candidatus Micrarchaeota archaeon]
GKPETRFFDAEVEYNFTKFASLLANHLLFGKAKGGGPKTDVQVGGKVTIPKSLLGHEVTLQFLKSLKKQYSDYEFLLTPKAFAVDRGKNKEVFFSVGVKHTTTGKTEPNLFFGMRIKAK